MHLSSLFIAACAATAAAQLVEEYFPECSVDCVTQATEDVTDCSIDDAWCQCIQENYEAIYDSGVNCVMQECGPDRAISEVLPAGVRFCSAATVEHHGTHSMTLPTESGTATTTTTTSSSPETATTPAATESEEEVTSTESDGAAPTAGPLGAFGLLVAGALAVL